MFATCNARTVGMYSEKLDTSVRLSNLHRYYDTLTRIRRSHASRDRSPIPEQRNLGQTTKLD
jgi:hypothetical protein